MNKQDLDLINMSEHLEERSFVAFTQILFFSQFGQ
jgi:hypothetical protein